MVQGSGLIKDYILLYFFTGSDKDVSCNKQEISKNRSHMFYKIVEQLTLPLRDDNTTSTLDEASGGPSGSGGEISTDGDPMSELNVKFFFFFNYSVNIYSLFVEIVS